MLASNGFYDKVSTLSLVMITLGLGAELSYAGWVLQSPLDTVKAELTQLQGWDSKSL